MSYDNWKLSNREDEEDADRRRAQRRLDAEDKAEHDADRAKDERADFDDDKYYGIDEEHTVDELTCICGELEWNCVCPG
jgi:hypothetical protein